MEFVRPADVAADEGTPGLSRQVLFETDHNVMVKSTVDGGTATGWHHHCERHAFGFAMAGEGTVEFGSDGQEQREISAPLGFHSPQGPFIARSLTPRWRWS